MAFGFYAANDSNQVICSDSSYTLEYIGKATLRTDIGYYGFNRKAISSSLRYYAPFGNTLYDDPQYMLGTYEIEAQASDLVAFSYVQPNDIFTGIVYQHQETSTTTRFYVITQGVTGIPNDPNAPIVYCFRKISAKPSLGSGLQIYDGSGNLTFTTQANTLRLKGGAALSINASTLRYGYYSSLYYGSNNNGVNALNIQNHSCIGSIQSMSKPAISFYPAVTGIANENNAGLADYYDLGIRYNSSIQQLQTQYGNQGNFYLGSYDNRNIPAYNSFAMMIDGSDYD